MKKTNKFNILFIAIPVLLCAVIISLTVFLPKTKTSSNKVNTSSDNKVNEISKTEVSSISQTDAASSPQDTKKEEKPVKYRLVYTLTDMRRLTEGMPTTRADDLFGDASREFVSQFEGQDVYFRVLVKPIVFYEETKEQGYTEEKGEELKKQRIEYVKNLGAKDMVLVSNTAYSYYASLNAEMINKIDTQGDCSMLLVNPPRPDEYHRRISDKLVYALETIEENETIDVKFSTDTLVVIENTIKPVEELFEMLDIRDEQITVKDYKEETVTMMGSTDVYKKFSIEASLTKKQIKDIAQYITGVISKAVEEDITIINVTEDTILPK